jgi:hypothetical protein
LVFKPEEEPQKMFLVLFLLKKTPGDGFGVLSNKLLLLLLLLSKFLNFFILGVM